MAGLKPEVATLLSITNANWFKENVPVEVKMMRKYPWYHGQFGKEAKDSKRRGEERKRDKLQTMVTDLGTVSAPDLNTYSY